MNIQAKQRVVGAIVLVSLAVIFLPILLPGKGGIVSRLDDTEAPPPPDYRFEPMAPAPEAPAIDAGVPVPLEVPAEKQDAKQASLATPEPASTPASKPAAASGDKGNPVSGWIVQVGSFSRQDNADTLRDSLRAQGFTSFVERIRANGDTVYRVRVGPELTRNAAERLQQKLMKDAKLNGLVQEYP